MRKFFKEGRIGFRMMFMMNLLMGAMVRGSIGRRRLVKMLFVSGHSEYQMMRKFICSN